MIFYHYCAFHKHANSKVQKLPSQLRFSLLLIIITITSNKPWSTETHKTDQNPPIRNHNPWPFEPFKVKFCFLRGPLRWLTAAKNAIVSWLLNFRICMFDYLHILTVFILTICVKWYEIEACIINVGGLYCRHFWPPFVCMAVCYSKIFRLQSKSVFTDCFFFPLQEVLRALQFQENFPLKSLQKLKYFVYMLVTVLQSTARLMIQVQMFLSLFLNTCHHTIYQACKEG